MYTVYMKQLILKPSIMGKTYLVLVDIKDDGHVVTERRDLGKGCTLERMVEILRGYNLPIFVDTSYPEVIDELKRYGHWVLK